MSKKNNKYSKFNQENSPIKTEVEEKIVTKEETVCEKQVITETATEILEEVKIIPESIKIEEKTEKETKTFKHKGKVDCYLRGDTIVVDKENNAFRLKGVIGSLGEIIEFDP